MFWFLGPQGTWGLGSLTRLEPCTTCVGRWSLTLDCQGNPLWSVFKNLFLRFQHWKIMKSYVEKGCVGFLEFGDLCLWAHVDSWLCWGPAPLPSVRGPEVLHPLQSVPLPVAPDPREGMLATFYRWAASTVPPLLIRNSTVFKSKPLPGCKPLKPVSGVLEPLFVSDLSSFILAFRARICWPSHRAVAKSPLFSVFVLFLNTLLSLYSIWLFLTKCQMLCVNKSRDTLKFGVVFSSFREDLLLLLRQLGQREIHLVQSGIKPVHT